MLLNYSTFQKILVQKTKNTNKTNRKEKNHFSINKSFIKDVNCLKIQNNIYIYKIGIKKIYF